MITDRNGVGVKGKCNFELVGGHVPQEDKAKSLSFGIATWN